MILRYALLPLVFTFVLPAAAQPAGSEILVFDLKLKKGKVVVSHPVNITNHPGYDNQPYFHNEDPVVYYSSFDDNGRADICSYNLKYKAKKMVTQTPEREYSPTLTPDRKYLSCIIQRDDGSQDLGKYPIEGGAAFVLINTLKVGYHAWADDSHIAMFVLEGEDKNSLHFMRLPTKDDSVLATNIGRSLHKIPGSRAISFIQRGESESKVMRLNTETMAVTQITNTIANGDHVAWTPTGLLLTSDGTKLYFLDPKHAGAGWHEVTLESGAEQLKGVTRLAVNSEGTRLAVVIAE
jgi:Tol biopolymer transport system component